MAALIPPETVIRFLPAHGVRQAPSKWHLVTEWRGNHPRKTVCEELPTERPKDWPRPWEEAALASVRASTICGLCIRGFTATDDKPTQSQPSLFD